MRPAWTAQIKDVIATCQPLALNESSVARLKLPRDGIESCYGGMSWGPGGLCASFLGCKVVQLGDAEAWGMLGGAGGVSGQPERGQPRRRARRSRLASLRVVFEDICADVLNTGSGISPAGKMGRVLGTAGRTLTYVPDALSDLNFIVSRCSRDPAGSYGISSYR